MNRFLAILSILALFYGCEEVDLPATDESNTDTLDIEEPIDSLNNNSDSVYCFADFDTLIVKSDFYGLGFK